MIFIVIYMINNYIRDKTNEMGKDGKNFCYAQEESIGCRTNCVYLTLCLLLIFFKFFFILKKFN